MSTAFASRTRAPQSDEQKKVSALAIKLNSHRRKLQKSGPVVVIVKSAA
jgi:hypothetical protein